MPKRKPRKQAREAARDALAEAIARFDLDDPELPEVIEEAVLKEGGYPYDEPIKKKRYAATLEELQVELVKLQAFVREAGKRLALVFEGRDTAGKGGTIFVFRQYMNPRYARVVALPKPTETERSQWYFQRYVAHLPSAGEIVFFDRSWYNRAGVEPVMGFCTEEETARFLAQAPIFERLLVEEGILLWKFWLNIGRAAQLKRFHERRHDPLKRWKLSELDYKAIHLFDDYTRARDRMLAATHTAHAPWTIVRAHDQRRARLNCIRTVLDAIDYPGKNPAVIGRPDAKIVGLGPEFLAQTERG